MIPTSNKPLISNQGVCALWDSIAVSVPNMATSAKYAILLWQPGCVRAPGRSATRLPGWWQIEPDSPALFKKKQIIHSVPGRIQTSVPIIIACGCFRCIRLSAPGRRHRSQWAAARYEKQNAIVHLCSTGFPQFQFQMFFPDDTLIFDPETAIETWFGESLPQT